MAKFLLHVGLPKTATTAVQQFVFQGLPTEDFHYVGTRQPRSETRSILFTKFMRAINSKPQDFDSHRAELSEDLWRLPLQKRNVISEEMFTVDTGIPWQTKIQRLANIMGNHDCRVLVTVREPLSAAFSLYVELWRAIRNDYPAFEDFLDSNQAKIYDYSILLPFLRECFGDQLYVLPFENTRRGRTFIAGLEDFLGVSVPLETLPRINEKPSLPEGVELQPLNVIQWLNLVANPSPLPIKFLLRVIFRALSPWRGRLDSIKCPWTRRVITKPDFAISDHKYAHSREWIRAEYGIEYSRATA